MRVSIITPVYNAEAYIEASVISAVAAATSVSFAEIIVVDNNSTDRSIKIAEDILSNSNVVYAIVREQVPGAWAARNAGARKARGIWLQFLDADDVLLPEKLPAQLNMAEGANPDVGCIYSNWARAKDDLTAASEERPRLRHDPMSLAIDLLSSEKFLAMGSQLLRASAFQQVGGFSCSHLIEDVELYLKLCFQGWQFQRCELPMPALLYRVHGAGLSSSNRVEFARAARRNARMLYDFAATNGRMDEEVKRAVSDCYFFAARLLARENWEAFKQVNRERNELGLRRHPSAPTHLRALSMATGYENAERVALLWSGIKAIHNRLRGRSPV